MSATVIGDYTIGPSAGPSSLLTNLAAFWKLEEASGTRVDSVGNNDLTDNNTVTQAAGRVGNAAQFTAVNTEWLSITDNTDLSTGDIDFTISCWVYMDSLGGTIIGKYYFSGTQREYALWCPSNLFQILVSSDGTAETGQNATTFGIVPTSTWCFVVAWHDSVNNSLNIQVNNGTVDSTSGYSNGVFNGSSDFNIGAMNNGAYALLNGRVDAVGFWKRVLTADERTELYNGGNGKEYPFS